LKIKPLNKRIHVEPITDFDLKKQSILIVAELIEKKPDAGKVVAVYPGCDQVNVGDVVLYGHYAGSTILMPDLSEVLLLNIEDVLGVVEA